MADTSISLTRAKMLKAWDALFREGWRYLAVSFVALLADYAVFLIAIGPGSAHYLIANILSFFVGALVAYTGSVYWVFAVRRISKPVIEFALFAAFGLFGLLIGSAVLFALVEWASVAPEIAKMVAAVASFFVNFAVRKTLLF